LLKNTFLHLSGITAEMEHQLWNRGIVDWDSLRNNLIVLKEIGDRRFFPDEILWELDQSEIALNQQNAHFFWSRIPYYSAWRIYTVMREKFYGLDIETTGLSYPHKVTCICLFDGMEIFQFTRTRNLDDFIDFWEDKDDAILLTYNGTKFDLPFINQSLHWKNPYPHLDLMHVLHKMGIKGGLKGSEVKLGISRDENLKGIDGFQAVQLWNQYVETDISDYLDLLVAYNQEDTINLHKILQIISEKKREEIQSQIGFSFP
jgi:uncharacterized protein YprB with RNaseH-like and TPR domain